LVEFKAWPKIGRIKDDNIIITEKMDGTNGCVIIEGGELVGVQSRKRLIKARDDNYGFASWCEENKEELLGLGEGYHYGEWVGAGIQKNPHALDRKYFYTFNTCRLADTLPDCVKQVAVLYAGPNSQEIIEGCMDKLYSDATYAKYVPEGIVVHYLLFDTRIKYTYKNTKGKWKNENEED